VRVIVVGAGLCGLSAAKTLIQAGHQVTVFDKGRSPGGRMATRRIGPARLDHGAQFFTIRSDPFAALIQPHIDQGLVYEWCRGFSGGGDGFPRYAVHGGMNALAKALAGPLDVRCNSLVFAIRPAAAAAGSGASWDVALDDGTSMAADGLVVTCPLPQANSLLVTAGTELPPDLISAEYDRAITLLVTLDRPSAVGEPGGLQNPAEALSFVSDNQRKGISDLPALTVHADAEWSQAHWDDDPAATIRALVDLADDYVGEAAVLEAQIKKWRFATPRTIWPKRSWVAPDGAGLLVLAGDAFAGPRVEGAVLSGLAAAAAFGA